MKIYRVKNIGCDDSNYFDIKLTDEQVKLVIRLFEENNKIANCCCTPHLFLYAYCDVLNQFSPIALNRDFYALNEIYDPFND
jgi:hypothetical protein